MNYQDLFGNGGQEINRSGDEQRYRYSSLLDAIKFFSNRLSVDQITEAAFEFINDFLSVKKSALFVREESTFVPARTHGCDNCDLIVSETPALAMFAVYYGTVITEQEQMERFFPKDLIESGPVNIIIPLMAENNLMGFFLISEKLNGTFDKQDHSLCEPLMMLFNSALENSIRLDRLQVSNRELDEKIFNLFAINQSARAMLNEHSLTTLNRLSVDVFSELTLSAHTGFILYDEPSEKYLLKAYRDVYHYEMPKGIEFHFKQGAKIHHSKNIVNLDNDIDKQYFYSLFAESGHAMESLHAKFVVFIYGDNNRVLGFATLGETVSGVPYRESAFELVDSLASYIYIALNNAILLKRVSDQKQLIETKLNRLVMLNSLVKNINSASSADVLIELALTTLDVSFGVQEGFVALYRKDRNELRISDTIRIPFKGGIIPYTEKMKPLADGQILSHNGVDAVKDFFGAELAGFVKSTAGFLAIPMIIEKYEKNFLGVVVLTHVADGAFSDEENLIVFETITNHMAPLLEGYLTLEQKIEKAKHNPATDFRETLRDRIMECTEVSADLEVIRIVDDSANPFDSRNIAQKLIHLPCEVFGISYDQTLLIVQQDFEFVYENVQRALENMQVELQRYRLNDDFGDTDGFIMAYCV